MDVEWLLSGLPARLLLGAYHLYPTRMRSVLDYFYLRSPLLQRVFKYRMFYPMPLGTDDGQMQELAQQCGLHFETHTVLSADGYLLTLHRVVRVSRSRPIDAHARALGKGKSILLFHGLMQDSESFLAGGSSSLAAALAHDPTCDCQVWLANSRGNKYVQKHATLQNDSRQFWNISLDDLILDVEPIIDYVLQRGGGSSLVCIGFSQGSAQLCGAISRNPLLNSKVSLLVCLAPAVPPASLAPSVLSTLAQRYPFLVGLLFGHKSMFSSVFLWQNILSARAFASVCVRSMHYLFGWSCKHISPERRARLFQYIYSPSSIVLVRHWFQIIRSGRLEGFDGRRYDLTGIKCPVAIIAGEEDKLIVPETLRDAVSRCVLFHIEPGYEHLDLLWADSSPVQIFPLVLEVIAKYPLSGPHIEEICKTWKIVC